MEIIEQKDFYVRPTNSILLETCNKVEKVSLDSIYGLATFALSLRQSLDVSQPDDYMSALAEFYGKNENEYSITYRKLAVSHFGLTLLFTVIKLALLEMVFRESGIDEQLAQVYNNERESYNFQLLMNQSMFHSEENIMGR